MMILQLGFNRPGIRKPLIDLIIVSHDLSFICNWGKISDIGHVSNGNFQKQSLRSKEITERQLGINIHIMLNK